jgi:hypothetical protein
MSLLALDSEEIAQVVFTVATPQAVCSILRTNSHVDAAWRHLYENAYEARCDIEEFVRERLLDLKSNTYFPHEPAFCALAVALETLPMPAAEDFLSELAALRIAEMPISPRVAALCLQRLRETLISKTLTEFKVKPVQIPDVASSMGLSRVPTESTYSNRLTRVPTQSTYPEIFKVAA